MPLDADIILTNQEAALCPETVESESNKDGGPHA